MDILYNNIPDSKIHGANMGPTHVGPMNYAIWDVM